ncbi:MAG: phosphate acyltransferase PlsX [Gammaproteobacteria bacterium]
MAQTITIALDAMGGDAGVSVCVPAGLGMLNKYPNLELILAGRREDIEPLLGTHRDNSRVRVVDAREVVEMDESPRDALRKKKDSSMRRAIDLVKSGEAHACVSAGNTGALMATARFVLKTIPGISRPAIMAAIPTIEGHAYMLDLGANSDCTAEHLFQFGVMGAVIASEVENIPQPRIGLLNIGEEDMKGNDIVREAAVLMGESNLNYVGFVEGTDISQQKADVIVCDGFSGNVALKVMEGTARLIRHFLKREFKAGLYGRLAAFFSWPVLNSLSKTLDTRRYKGASLVGLSGIVIKSHGGADELAFRQAIKTALIEVEKDVPRQIHKLWDEQAI